MSHPKKHEVGRGLALHICTCSKYIAYAMVPIEKRGKLDAKGIKFVIFGYCEGMETYMLMCLQTKKITIKNRDVVFI